MLPDEMLFFKSLLLLVAGCSLSLVHAQTTTVAPSNTTISNDTSTQSPITVAPPPPPPPEPTQCLNPSAYVSAPETHLPSDEVEIRCSCCGDEKIHGGCPDITVDDEFLPYLAIKSGSITRDGNNCTTRTNVTARGDLLTRRRFDFKFDCVFKNLSVASRLGSFEQSSYRGQCQYTGDCASVDFQCFQNQCICYEDTSSFVRGENKCFPDAKFGAKCIYDEQCQTNTKNSVCKDKSCQCKDNYSLDGNKECTSGSSALFPPVMVILGALILTTLQI